MNDNSIFKEKIRHAAESLKQLSNEVRFVYQKYEEDQETVLAMEKWADEIVEDVAKIV